LPAPSPGKAQDAFELPIDLDDALRRPRYARTLPCLTMLLGCSRWRDPLALA
jgi:hypothetical protein